MSLAESIRYQLLKISKERGETFDRILTLYGIERFLYRLSQSKWKDKFILKGAMLFTIWQDLPYRPTKDIDLLGVVKNDIKNIQGIFSKICSTNVIYDGLSFLAETINCENIQKGNQYKGIRVRLDAILVKARIRIQIDIGFGDLVTPAPKRVKLRPMLSFPGPSILAYSVNSVIAEKFHAMAKLGIANSRIKDFYDIWIISKYMPISGPVLFETIIQTFKRRGDELPGNVPFALTQSFWSDTLKQKQWLAYINKNKLSTDGHDFQFVVEDIKRFFSPIITAFKNNDEFNSRWSYKKGWKE